MAATHAWSCHRIMALIEPSELERKGNGQVKRPEEERGRKAGKEKNGAISYSRAKMMLVA